MESRSYPITLKTIVLSARGGPFWATPRPYSADAFPRRFPVPSCVIAVATRTFDFKKILPTEYYIIQYTFRLFLEGSSLQHCVISNGKLPIVLRYYFQYSIK